MKKIKIFLIDVSIVLFFILFLYFLSYTIRSIKGSYIWLADYKEMLARKLANPESVGNSVEDLQTWISNMQKTISIEILWICLFSLSVLACVFLFVYCNPRLFRRSTWTNLSEEWAKNKEERLTARAAKAEADKQKRIEELQSELNELNGNDKN